MVNEAELTVANGKTRRNIYRGSILAIAGGDEEAIVDDKR
jgi:hypothetical protein